MYCFYLLWIKGCFFCLQHWTCNTVPCQCSHHLTTTWRPRSKWVHLMTWHQVAQSPCRLGNAMGKTMMSILSANDALSRALRLHICLTTEGTGFNINYCRLYHLCWHAGIASINTVYRVDLVLKYLWFWMAYLLLNSCPKNESTRRPIIVTLGLKGPYARVSRWRHK